MLGPSFNPVVLVLVITAFFVGVGYFCYLFGQVDANGRSKSPGL